MGPEIELDAGTANFHEPALPTGWECKPDGSLRNGKEYVLEPPQPLGEVLPAVELFSEAATAAKMHVALSGGFHIHVQAADYTHEDAFQLCRIYQHFQPVIDRLVGKSRRSSANNGRGNSHCLPIDLGRVNTAEQFAPLFHLGSLTSDRSDAKRARLKWVVNCAMLRVRDPVQRSVEFRQPSASKHTANIYGWLCLAVALTDAARLPECRVFVDRQPTVLNFMRLLRMVERQAGAAHLAAWALWRMRYLEARPTTRQRRALLSCLTQQSHGLFHIARHLNVNLAVAQRMVSDSIRDGSLKEDSPGKYRANYSAVAEIDLALILELWQALEVGPQVQAAPAQARR